MSSMHLKLSFSSGASKSRVCTKPCFATPHISGCGHRNLLAAEPTLHESSKWLEQAQSRARRTPEHMNVSEPKRRTGCLAQPWGLASGPQHTHTHLFFYFLSHHRPHLADAYPNMSIANDRMAACRWRTCLRRASKMLVAEYGALPFRANRNIYRVMSKWDSDRTWPARANRNEENTVRIVGVGQVAQTEAIVHPPPRHIASEDTHTSSHSHSHAAATRRRPRRPHGRRGPGPTPTKLPHHHLKAPKSTQTIHT